MKRTHSGTRPIGHIVLIVDDDPAARSTLAVTLAGEGFGVLESAGGPEALNAARAARPDVILLDLSLPDVDGAFEVARRLTNDRRTRRIPVIALTVGHIDAQSASGLGFTAVLTRPCAPEVLLESLAAVLARVEKRQTA